ncbi:GTP cyclohydrolase II, partial [Acinetobacter baumannii]
LEHSQLLLNLPADARRYDMCSIMLDHLKVKEVKLITNNPLKIQALKDQGINVVDRVPLTVGRNPFNEQYLKTKRERMDHLYQKDDF